MRNSSSFEEHLLLPKAEDETLLTDEGFQQRPKDSRWPMFGWIVAVFAFFVAVDVMIYLRITRLLSVMDIPPTELPIRYSYIGLGEMYSSTDIAPSKFDPLINVPILATQISRAEPDKVFPVDTHQWLSDYGTLSPPDRNLHVTNTINTIVQFHILDWGMEKCAFTVRLPAQDAFLPHEYTVKDIRGTLRLDICELDATRPLNPLDLTWRKRPKCIKHAGTIDARVGEEVQLASFACQTGTFRAFEVSCAHDTPNCWVNVWSNHNETWGTLSCSCAAPTADISPGLYLTQYQTV
ncbi:hypothetical protein AN958_10617 [Leucoagaricus sp. SymC.cos]|nr:hypothetical protein AN958_10617 [Leucoagaricus sp. SymC.cos]